LKKSSKILARRRADDNHEVVTVSTKSGDYSYRRRPCEECPWRKDSPAGAFPAEAYRISAKTAYNMAQSTFACHMAGQAKPTTCAGFLLRGAEHSLAVRLLVLEGKVDLRKVGTDVELYDNYRAMAEANGVSPDDPALTACR
jgi:hypothetical protein